MYKYCATEDGARRQRQLEACLQELMLAENYPQITVGHICDLAGIARKSFYRYFSSKEDCLYGLIDHAIFNGTSFYMPDHHSSHSNTDIYERFFRYWKEQHLLLDALSRNGMTVHLIQRMMDYSALEESTFRFQLNIHSEHIREHSLFFIGGAMTLVFQWHKSGFEKSALHMAQILKELID